MTEAWKTSMPKDRRAALEAEKRTLMRQSKTNTTWKHGMGGMPKTAAHLPKPITLPKVNLPE